MTTGQKCSYEFRHTSDSEKSAIKRLASGEPPRSRVTGGQASNSLTFGAIAVCLSAR
eukprot:CAMPEP_0203745154 /NCGR_PEP_ID=MMETSP0098-20131031/987_1 /ASSEMBLY_ACC=CAM_ASM_000208 /TAXON_ID=96639 /ORGANISM=" , Strain NY0313808BC1" /LENGTH=56 /DNA_ID=CAMNT_0050632855 /DNA_START=522 /DNA_END=688 /DNA_ORIENTATION=-